MRAIQSAHFNSWNHQSGLCIRYCFNAPAHLIVIGDSNPNVVSLRMSERISNTDGCIGMVGMAVHIHMTDAFHGKIGYGRSFEPYSLLSPDLLHGSIPQFLLCCFCRNILPFILFGSSLSGVGKIVVPDTFCGERVFPHTPTCDGRCRPQKHTLATVH